MTHDLHDLIVIAGNRTIKGNKILSSGRGLCPVQICYESDNAVAVTVKYAHYCLALKMLLLEFESRHGIDAIYQQQKKKSQNCNYFCLE